MNVIKRVLAKRQAIRLHIEQMKVTEKALRERAKHHHEDTLAYETAKKAAFRLQDKIAKAEAELTILERKWSW
jgi:hypothetical protein